MKITKFFKKKIIFLLLISAQLSLSGAKLKPEVKLKQNLGALKTNLTELKNKLTELQTKFEGLKSEIEVSGSTITTPPPMPIKKEPKEKPKVEPKHKKEPEKHKKEPEPSPQLFVAGILARRIPIAGEEGKKSLEVQDAQNKIIKAARETEFVKYFGKDIDICKALESVLACKDENDLSAKLQNLIDKIAEIKQEVLKKEEDIAFCNFANAVYKTAIIFDAGAGWVKAPADEKPIERK